MAGVQYDPAHSSINGRPPEGILPFGFQQPWVIRNSSKLGSTSNRNPSFTGRRNQVCQAPAKRLTVLGKRAYCRAGSTPNFFILRQSVERLMPRSFAAWPCLPRASRSAVRILSAGVARRLTVKGSDGSSSCIIWRTISSRTTFSLQTATMRSMMFCSSRTLPGQAYPSKTSKAGRLSRNRRWRGVA